MEAVSAVVECGNPEGLHRGSCLTSAWQCLVPALRAHEAQGGLRHVPTEAGQLWLTHIGPELHLWTESEAMKSLMPHHPSHTQWACSVFRLTFESPFTHWPCSRSLFLSSDCRLRPRTDVCRMTVASLGRGGTAGGWSSGL